MKVSCCHCGKDIDSVVQRQFAVYEVGKVVCPHCHKLNKRYISAVDLHIAIMGTMVIYGIVLAAMSFITKSFYGGEGDILSAVCITIASLVIVIVGISNWSLYVYNKAPMKNEWMNYTMHEDAYDVTKACKREFKGYIFLVIVLGLIAMYASFLYYVIGILVYLLLMYVKLLAILKKEKKSYSSR